MINKRVNKTGFASHSSPQTMKTRFASHSSDRYVMTGTAKRLNSLGTNLSPQHWALTETRWRPQETTQESRVLQ